MISMETICTALVMCGIGAAVGGMFAPAVADKLLKRTYDKVMDWYDRSMDAWEKWCGQHPGKHPEPGKPGEEGALAIWAEDALRTISLGALDASRAARVHALGVDAAVASVDAAAARAAAVDQAKATAKATAAASLQACVPSPFKKLAASIRSQEDFSGSSAGSHPGQQDAAKTVGHENQEG